MNKETTKAEFFAQYMGQKIAMYKTDTSVKLIIGHHCVDTAHIDKIELKHLSQITDEDAIEVAKIAWDILTVRDSQIDSGKKVSLYFLETPKINGKTAVAPRNTLRISDFLRSRGYLLPFSDLSTDELISRGWVKLKEPKV